MSQRHQRGAVLVIALAAVAAVTVSVAIYAKNQNDAVRTVIDRTENRRAQFAAQAGIQRAMTELQLLSESPQEPVTDTDTWALLGANGADNFILGSTSFRLQIVDACARVDLNTATQDQLSTMPFTSEQIDSLLDWREAGTSPRPEGGKDEFYNQLDKAYNSGQVRFQSVTELLNVKGFTPQSLFEVQENTINTGVSTTNTEPVPLIALLGLDAFCPNNAPDGNGRVNVNQTQLTAQQLAQNAQISQQSATAIINARNARPNRQFASMTQLFQTPGVGADARTQRNLLDRVTTSNLQRLEGRINANTAPIEVLATIPGITSDLAQTIVDNRSSNPYRQLSDLLNVNSSPAFLGSLADSVTVQSESFLVRVIGKAGATTFAIEALVSLEDGLPKILRIEEPLFSAPEQTWGWDTASNEVTLLQQES